MRALSSLLAAATLALAACASMPPSGSGKYLVYRDTTGAPAMQIDYPSDYFCRQVEAVAAGNARCQPQSAADRMQAGAALRYDPPGMMVEAHYADLVRCHVANSRMASGVELVRPCAAK